MGLFEIRRWKEIGMEGVFREGEIERVWVRENMKEWVKSLLEGGLGVIGMRIK